MELQLPPHLDTLLHNIDDEEFAEHGEMMVVSRDGIGTWSHDLVWARGVNLPSNRGRAYSC
jgi:hypothetical protein